MAGMFYSLQEAAEKLNKTEDELKQMVKEGKLREFRDGQNLLFKVEEVEALMSESGAPVSKEPLAPETPSPEDLTPETPEPEAPAPSEKAADSSEILLAPETGAPVAPSELTDADTALTGEGISVLGETDSDYQITDDTMAETAIPTGTTPEVPLEEIEEDVNLDSFGSGSGLLDLSLQADDTSLGGILDEIYTAEEEGKEPAEAASGSAAVAAEAEEMVSEEELVESQPSPELPAPAIARPYIEVTPDAQSNILGMLLFLPLAIVLYTTVVAWAGRKGVMPSILATIQGLIWYIMGGAVVLALLVVGAAFMLTGEREAKTKKQKKPKKQKQPKKPKKSKKAEKT